MTPNRFPLKTALAFASAVAALAALHLFYDPTKGLNPGIVADALRLNLIRHPASEITAKTPPPKPLNNIQQPGTHTLPGQQHLPPVTENFIDDSGSLDPFYTALRSLELPETASTTPQVVTVLHYGDSPTTADLITGDVRSLLQQRFGDAGHGFLLTAKPWAWYQHRDIDISDHEWKISTAVGKGHDEVYGIGGASFEGSTGANSRITLHDKPPAPGQTSVEIDFLARPNGGDVTVASNGTAIARLSTAADTAHPASHIVDLPPDTRTLDLAVASSQARLFGETFRTGHRGVLYDSLGLNGASTSVLSNGFNAAAWATELQHTQPALVIINYGTNESGFGTYVDKQYEPTLRTAIKRIRTALPGVPILVMSPMDRGRRTGVDQIETYDTIPRIIAIQRRVAAEQNCAFFDTFNAMGGDGTMSRWYTGHPRLVAGDLIHPTPQGAAIVAGLFVKDLMLGYDRYLRAHPDGRSLPPLQPAPAQPARPLQTQPISKPSAATPLAQPVTEPEPATDPQPEPPKAPPA